MCAQKFNENLFKYLVVYMTPYVYTSKFGANLNDYAKGCMLLYM